MTSPPPTLEDRRTAVDALRQAGDRLRMARAEEAIARAALDELVVAARRAGASQQDVVALSGLSRETVRTIERDGGIEPPPGWVARAAGSC